MDQDGKFCISLEGTICSLITSRDPKSVGEFFVSRGVVLNQSVALTSMFFGLMDIHDRAYMSPETSGYLMDYLLESHADIARMFCMISTNVAMSLFAYAVSLDIKVSEWQIQNAARGDEIVADVFYTRELAQKLFPTLIEIETAQCCNGTIIYPGQYDTRMFAAIMLGACGAPLRFIDDLQNHFDGYLLVNHALRSLHSSVAQSPDLITDYESADFPVFRPVAVRAQCPLAITSQSVSPMLDDLVVASGDLEQTSPARKLHIVRHCDRKPTDRAAIAPVTSAPKVHRDAQRPGRRVRPDASCSARIHASYHAPSRKRVEICAT